jgi:hypothetical protein
MIVIAVVDGKRHRAPQQNAFLELPEHVFHGDEEVLLLPQVRQVSPQGVRAMPVNAQARIGKAVQHEDGCLSAGQRGEHFGDAWN